MLNAIAPALLQRIEFPDDEVDAAAAVLALLHAMVRHGRALQLLAETDVAESAFVILRALFEGWLQALYILNQPDRQDAGRRCLIFGLLELLDHVKDWPGGGFEEASTIRTRVDEWRTDHPQLVAEIEAQRAGDPAKKKRPTNYWTGMGPSALIRKVATYLDDRAELAMFYKLAWWDAHQVVNPAVEVRILRRPGEISLTFGQRSTPADEAAFSCLLASRMLAKVWTDAVKVLRLTVPPPASTTVAS